MTNLRNNTTTNIHASNDFKLVGTYATIKTNSRLLDSVIGKITTANLVRLFDTKLQNGSYANVTKYLVGIDSQENISPLIYQATALAEVEYLLTHNVEVGSLQDYADTLYTAFVDFALFIGISLEQLRFSVYVNNGNYFARGGVEL